MIITTTTLTLFLCVCAATAATTGFFLALAAFLIARSVTRYAKATEDSNDAATQFLNLKRDELAVMLGQQKGPRVAQMDPAALLRGLRPAPSGDDKGPKGSA